MADLSFQFPGNHPCGAGHFPGNPVIPGALLLEEVLTRIAADLAIDGCTWRVKFAKFPRSVRPGDTVHLSYSRAANDEIRFKCAVSDSKVMSGIATGIPAEKEGLPS